jgi:hypothetical protein
MLGRGKEGECISFYAAIFVQELPAVHLNQFLQDRPRAADSMAPLVVSNQIIFAAVISAVIAMVTKVAPDNATAVNQALMTMVAGAVIWQLKTITSIPVKIKVHTEVINSRTNHIEGRSMLQFAAQWHNVSPQVAYRLCRRQACRCHLALPAKHSGRRKVVHWCQWTRHKRISTSQQVCRACSELRPFASKHMRPGSFRSTKNWQRQVLQLPGIQTMSTM